MKPLLVTSGEPAGIGVDLCIQLAHLDLNLPFVVMADPTLLLQRAHKLGLELDIHYYQPENAYPTLSKGQLAVWPIALRDKVVTGQLNPNNSEYVLEMLETATYACLDGLAAGMVTAPVQKSVINDAGFTFSGHTEFLQGLCKVPNVVMMLACPDLRVALATTHLPLRAVAEQITPELLTEVIDILHRDLQQKFALPAPRILVTGLNPHAGENGYLGREEIDIINPTLSQLRAKGIDVSEALPADTLFTADNLAHCDAVLAMYHDQGLPVLKAKGFGEAVNITLGLPIIRTSVDHGTALALAGTGQAKVGSLLAALQMAATMAYGTS
ncbi:4-hydroxythreonine-4-phosphate dehydrogenase PdxA [Agitococcus lubricus]|uniref:4-hydroxythreonine-4-phosphate dehydrogenase n=1 Tax=Agitococcus lubricus TaxID=1077255 RepID=A0A2T5J1B4_9GAMM|nr:4-hydroxythreonine-4-phosphate dehydrogenase PdxA [Agitococcus lubricus]PTQ90134.1 4-hydroxythreonine-4-phosphate dehydrogenase [Agitococcus lubricus]